MNHFFVSVSFFGRMLSCFARNIFLLCFVFFFSETAAVDDYESVIQNACSLNKPVILFFHASWCGWCHKLEKEVFTDPGVKTALLGFEMVSVDADDHGKGAEIYEKYRKTGLPTLVFLTPEQKEYRRLVGYLPVADFSSLLKESMSMKDPLDALMKQWEDENFQDTVQTALKIMETLFYRGRYDEVLVFSKNAGARKGFIRSAEFYHYEAMSYLKQKLYKEALPILLKASLYANEESLVKEIYRNLELVYKKLEKQKSSVKIWEIYTQRFPHSWYGYNAYAWKAQKIPMELDKALEFAKKAVQLSDGSAGVLDTLAEVYFQRKEYEMAIEISLGILEKEKNNVSYKKSLERYQKALKEAQ